MNKRSNVLIILACAQIINQVKSGGSKENILKAENSLREIF
jgi:hypothetical protein